MAKKPSKKEKKRRRQLTAKDLDKTINALETALKATERMPPGLQEKLDEMTKQYKEIHSMFTAMKGFSVQQVNSWKEIEGTVKRLESAFTSVMAGINEVKAVLGAPQKTEKATPATHVENPIPNLPIEKRLKEKLHFKIDSFGSLITADYMPNKDEWTTCNKALKNFGWKWISDGNKSRWVKQ